VIVGVIDGATVPPWHVTLRATMPEEHFDMFRQRGGLPFPERLVSAARRELEGLARLLEGEGVKVRRPDVADFGRPFATPLWQSTGLYAAMPRDVLLVVGDELIEAPMPWRCRHFEVLAYRRLLREYFAAGARWTSAPKPALADDLYDETFVDPEPGRERYCINDSEPVFDAADFVRCGRDILAQLSNVTNASGVEWLRRHLGDRYRVHVLKLNDTHPMHIDASVMPLAPGRVLVCPERVPSLPPMFKDWEVLAAPPPARGDHPMFMSSRWVSMNVIMLDERHVVVERNETDLIAAFKSWGFTPLPCDFRNFNAFGGSFHCATLDVRRRGTLRSYFPSLD
jgi:glycine amidinotransferase